VSTIGRLPQTPAPHFYNLGRFCLWKKGIRHSDISLGNLMWAARKVGILNDFDPPGSWTRQVRVGKTTRGPYHSWRCCLCLATVVNTKGKNLTMDSHSLPEWFHHWKGSHAAKKDLEWREHNRSNIPLAHLNTRNLASALHKYWLGRFNSQFPIPSKMFPGLLAGAFKIPISTSEGPPYEEPEDDRVF
jgi:hypothetical protein